jgi:hypothetical protein
MDDGPVDPRLFVINADDGARKPTTPSEEFCATVVDVAGDVVTATSYAVKSIMDQLPPSLVGAHPAWTNAAIAAALVAQAQHFVDGLPSAQWETLVEILADNLIARIREHMEMKTPGYRRRAVTSTSDAVSGAARDSTEEGDAEADREDGSDTER